MTFRSDDEVFAVRQYVAHVVGVSLDRVTSVDRFEQGNRHDVYRVSYVDSAGTAGDVVVRVAHDSDSRRRVDAAREARVLSKLDGVGAPALIDFQPTNSWFERPVMCMQSVVGRARELSSADTNELGRLGAVVRSVHNQTTEGLEDLAIGGDMSSYADERVHTILHNMSWIREPLPGATQDQLHVAGRSVTQQLKTLREGEAFRTTEPLALLHGDIGPGNILWGPDPVLIDWEYARIGDPADELAYLFDQNGLTQTKRDAFWQGYAAPDDVRAQLSHVRARVDWWERVTLFGSTLWWVERWVRRMEADADGRTDATAPKDAEYYSDQVARRLRRLPQGTR